MVRVAGIELNDDVPAVLPLLQPPQDFRDPDVSAADAAGKYRLAVRAVEGGVPFVPPVRRAVLQVDGPDPVREQVKRLQLVLAEGGEIAGVKGA